MKKIDAIKILSLVSGLLGLAGTLVSNYASSKELKDAVAKEVAKQIRK